MREGAGVTICRTVSLTHVHEVCVPTTMLQPIVAGYGNRSPTRPAPAPLLFTYCPGPFSNTAVTHYNQQFNPHQHNPCHD